MFGSRLNDRFTICGGMCGSLYEHVGLIGEIEHSGFSVIHSFELRAQFLFDFEIESHCIRESFSTLSLFVI